MENFDEKMYETAAEMIFRQLVTNPQPDLDYRPENLLYKDLVTLARVYVGNETVEQDYSKLKELGISAVVNCTTKLAFHHEKRGISYYRFPVINCGYGKTTLLNSESDFFDFVNPALDFIDGSLRNGKSVLIHCSAGVHRAGTVAVLFLMGQYKLPVGESLSLAKKLRPGINPFGSLLTFLKRFEEVIAKANEEKRLSKEDRWFRAA